MGVGMLSEAFCRTLGGHCVKALKMVRGNGFGNLGLAGMVEKKGVNVDLSMTS